MFKHIAGAIAMVGLSASIAHADPDLEISFVAPNRVDVYETKRYKVRVKNVGDADALGTTVRIDLPITNTSPTQHVMGTLGAIKNNCTQVGNALECTLNKVKINRRKTVWFEISLPASSEDIEFYAETETNTPEGNLNNNDMTHIAALDSIATTINAPVDMLNRHCTGQSLTAFFECTLYPSSISSHDAVYNADNTVSFPNQPATFSGTWSQPTADTLTFEYTNNGATVAEFYGVGVGNDCFEGLTIFPDGNGGYSPWVAPYEICIQ